jgi:serine/threonine protein kinase
MNLIGNKYILLDKINEGAFGSVYRAKHKRTGQLVAVKLEHTTTSSSSSSSSSSLSSSSSSSSLSSSLKNEAKIYQYLNNIPGFPQLKSFGTTTTTTTEQKQHYLVTELLGDSLATVIHRAVVLPVATICQFGIQMITLLQQLHDKQLLHRDIKPSNFVFGLEPTNTTQLYLIDFGFSKRYDYDGVHIPATSITYIIGSLNYVSVNIHNGIEPSRRDDMESCVYIILTMLMRGNLAWFHTTDKQAIYTLKQHLLDEPWVPNCIKHMLRHLRQLTFEEAPNYAYLIGLLSNK